METTRDIDPNLLLSNYSTCEEQDLRYDFTQEEVTRMKADFFKTASEKGTKDEMIKGLKAILDQDNDDFKTSLEELVIKFVSKLGVKGLKTLTTEYSDLLQKVNRGYEIRKAMIYTMDYSEEGRLEFFDAQGKFLFEKKIAGQFHQMHILSNKLKTNVNE